MHYRKTYKGILIAAMALFLVSCEQNSINSINEPKDSLVVTGKEELQYFPDAPGYYTNNNNSDSLIIQFELYAGNKPMITGKINNKNARFLIDNGKLFNEIWFYNGETDSLNLYYKTHEADSLIGIGEKEANPIYDGNPVNLSFTNVQFMDQPTLISPSESGYADFFPGINGQISSTLFKHFIVSFDFENLSIYLHKPEQFTPDKNQHAIKMQKRNNGSYCIPFELTTKTGETHKVLLDIDIGTVFPLYLISTNTNNIAITDKTEKQFVGMGGSGEIYGFKDTLAELKLGNYSFKNYPVIIAPIESNSDTNIVENGTFGIELMKNFTITFDYFNEILYLEPNKNFKGIDCK